MAPRYWIAVNGTTCALSSLPMENPTTVPTAEQMWGFPTLEEARNAQNTVLDKPMHEAVAFLRSLGPDIKAGRVLYRRPDDPQPPPTRGETRLARSASGKQSDNKALTRSEGNMDRMKDLIEFWRTHFAETNDDPDCWRRYLDGKMRELEAAFPGINKDDALYAYEVAASEQDAKRLDDLWEEIQRGAQRTRCRVPEDPKMVEGDANFIHNAEEPERLFNAFLATLKT
jgi:hypothetical protein